MPRVPTSISDHQFMLGSRAPARLHRRQVRDIHDEGVFNSPSAKLQRFALFTTAQCAEIVCRFWRRVSIETKDYSSRVFAVDLQHRRAVKDRCTFTLSDLSVNISQTLARNSHEPCGERRTSRASISK